MKRFSIGTAIGDGFRLVARRPLAVFVWGILMLAPMVVGVALMLPAIGALAAEAPAGVGADAAGVDLMFAQMVQMQMASLLMNIGQMLMMGVIYTAIFRAVLRPGETRAFSLRIGVDELRVAVVGVAIGMGIYATLMIVMLFGLAVGFSLWGVDPTLMLPVFIVAGLGLVVALFWAMARVSMMAPASVLYRDFAFVQGWRLARGQAWPLFGMMVLIGLTILAIEMVLIALGFLAFGGALAIAGDSWSGVDANVNPFAGINAWVAANWYWVIVASAFGALVYGVILTLSVAPFASACRQLADSEAAISADTVGDPL